LLIFFLTDVFLKFDCVSEKLTSEFEARKLCTILHGYYPVCFDKVSEISKQTFKCLVSWWNQHQDINHLDDLRKALDDIDRNDVVEELNDIHHAKFTDTIENIEFPDRNITKREMDCVTRESAAAYYRLAIFLGVSPNELDEIESDNRRVREKMSCVLEKRPFTRQEICDGLKYIHRVDVIKKLKDMWTCTNKRK
jgi:hypothetical protein